MIEVIPAVDIIDGRCVRLSQGDYARRTVYRTDPVEQARRYAGCGIRRMHLVDLDGAKAAAPCNLRVLERIAELDLLQIEWGGGIKTDAALQSVWDAGADWAIIGSIAVKEPSRMTQWLARWGDRIILGADTRGGKVAVNGWLEDSLVDVETLIGQFAPCGLKTVICTDIARDGMLTGPSWDLYTRLKAAFPGVAVVVSGGVASIQDVSTARGKGLDGIIIGKAIYEGKITLEEIASCLQNG